MISGSLIKAVKTFQANVQVAKPIATLTPLQLAVLVAQGNDLVVRIDGELQANGAALDRPDPTGHPLAMIADVRRRLSAAADQTALSDLRGLVGRAVFNLAQASA